MNVDYDKWGKVLDGADAKEVHDKDGNVVGYIRDERRFVYEPDERPVTKKEVLDEISGWRNDDGSYGIDDVHIFVAYDDGTFFDSGSSGKRYREKFKKTGIIGASVSTGDYEMVWGGEKGKNGELIKWETWTAPDSGEKGKSNSYSGYKAVGKYYVRVKTTYNNLAPDGTYRTKKQTIRKSKVKRI